MNLSQFLTRWPSQDARLFLFSGGKDHDRLATHALVADRWTDKVHSLDVARLHTPTFSQLTESLRSDPIASKQRVCVATELQWDSPSEASVPSAVQSLTKLLTNFPRDQVLVASCPDELSQDTKNDLAQAIIRKGYWVALKTVDAPTACDLLRHLTGWDDDELINTVVDTVGTSPSDLISWLRVTRLSGADETLQGLAPYLEATPTGTVFDLVDAIVMKDTERALTLASSDIPAGQLIGALDRKFSSLLQFMAEMKKGRTAKEAAMMLRLPGFIVHGLYEASKRWTGREIVNAWPALAEHSLRADRPGTNELLILDLVGV